MTSIKSRCVVFLMTLTMVYCVPLDFTTSRSLHFEPVEKSGNQLMEMRKTSEDIILDTRTPPKIRVHTKKKEKDDHMEYSHAGVAIPVDEDAIQLEETTKKLNFYKIQRPTTNSGLSTWILLNGDSTSTTPKVINTNDTADMRVIEVTSGSKIMKPAFKKRTSTARTTQATTPKNKPSTEPSTRKPKPTTLVKIKASTLNNAKKKNETKTIGTSIKEVTEHPMEKIKVTLFNRLSNIKTTTEKAKIEPSISKNENKTDVATVSDKTEVLDSQNSQPEGKEGDTNITEAPNSNKKKKTKTRKNKNKRKKPQEKTSNSTIKATKNKNQLKEKPLGTQIYNYLSREMMPTLGVGLVGLMVTAGLASYFLYPFGIARRVYEVDRKDKEGSYYYNDLYSGGIAEEEAFGRVIAGMPLEKLQSSMYSSTQTTRRPIVHQQKTYYPSQNYQNPQQQHQKPHMSQNTKNYHSRTSYSNHHNNNNNGMVQGTVESVPLGSTQDSYLVNSYSKDSYQVSNYKNNEVDMNKNTDQKFVVGSAPKGSIEEITPAAVPEHGPRMLKLTRRKRDTYVDDMENDVLNDKEITDNSIGTNEKISTTEENLVITTVFPTPSATNSTNSTEEKVKSVVALIRDIFHLKLNLGLELVKNATRSVSNYIEKVQSRLESHYRTTQNFF